MNCKAKRCPEPSGVTYLGVDLCDGHWFRACENENTAQGVLDLVPQNAENRAELRATAARLAAALRPRRARVRILDR